MSPRKKAQAAFASALLLLLLGGMAAYVSIFELIKSERWVTHTREVQARLGDVEFAAAKVGRIRVAYLATGDPALLNDFSVALEDAPRQLQHLRDITKDNPSQQALCSRLEKSVQQRMDLSRQAVELKKLHPELQQQEEIASQSSPMLLESTTIVQQMRNQEQELLLERERSVQRLSVITLSILAITLVMAIAMFFVHYRLLSWELTAREQAERAAHGLSMRLMQTQDEERRRFSRELHDSLGQYLASLKMNLEVLLAGHEGENRYAESVKLLETCIVETRTISHLLHPPILDFAGLCSAAVWFTEGFAERSGIQVKTNIPDTGERLPEVVEMVLFRVLQESLTNIHRHSRSSNAEVTLKIAPAKATLVVQDFGVGIPEEVLERFKNSGTTGVGLAGMRERVRELGGDFHIEGGRKGTKISASIPFTKAMQIKSDRAAS
jgi:signal transduction histidine kinase